MSNIFVREDGAMYQKLDRKVQQEFLREAIELSEKSGKTSALFWIVGFAVFDNDIMERAYAMIDKVDDEHLDGREMGAHLARAYSREYANFSTRLDAHIMELQKQAGSYLHNYNAVEDSFAAVKGKPNKAAQREM